jgi:hypothetical protein
MDSKRDLYLIKSKKASIVLVLSLLICFVFFMLGQIQTITDFNFTLHEMFLIPINIGIFLIPLEVIFVLFYFTRWDIELRKASNGKLKL